MGMLKTPSLPTAKKVFITVLSLQLRRKLFQCFAVGGAHSQGF
jgi:hypothetical protein